MVDGVAAVGDAVDLDHRLLAHDVDGLGEVDEGAFGHERVGETAFEHEFGLGGNDQVVGQATDERGGREGMGDVQLADAGRRGHAGGQEHMQGQADADGDGQIALSFAPGGVGATMLDDAGGQAVGVEPQQAMEGGVEAGVRACPERHKDHAGWRWRRWRRDRRHQANA